MTVVAGLIDHAAKKIKFSADRGITTPYLTQVAAESKIFKTKIDGSNKSMLVGGAGPARIVQFIKHSFIFPEHEQGQDDLCYMVNYLIPNLEAELTELLAEDDNFEALFGYCGKLYVVESDYYVGYFSSGYQAIGSAKELALGSLFTSDSEVDSSKRLRTAMKAAIAFGRDIREPFDYLSISF